MLRSLTALALLLVAFVPSSVGAKPAPDLKFHDLAGHDHHLTDLRGSLTVISFWATWCAPCREELPRLSVLSQQYAAQGVRFIAISVDEPKDFPKIQPFLQQQHVALDVWTGADIGTLDRLSLGDVVPATIVLDRNGEVVGRISGEAQDPDVKGYLDWLLGNRQGPAPAPKLKRS
jgi:thiol-disulfide isomerase/thioredoxin